MVEGSRTVIRSARCNSAATTARGDFAEGIAPAGAATRGAGSTTEWGQRVCIGESRNGTEKDRSLLQGRGVVRSVEHGRYTGSKDGAVGACSR